MEQNLPVRKCCTCKIDKTYSEFYKDNAVKSRVSRRCKNCVKLKARESDLRDPERTALRIKNWINNNHERRLEIQRNYRKNGGEELKSREGKYKIKNRDRNKKLISERNKFRMRNDPTFWIKRTLRRRFSDAMRIAKTRKLHSTREVSGSPFDEIKKYIERQFKEGMTWENHGITLMPDKNGNVVKKWQIDHLICLECFDLFDPRHQKLAFNYTNLHPMWSQDNKNKNDFLLDGRQARNLTIEEKREIIDKSFNENNHLKPEIIEQIKAKWN